MTKAEQLYCGKAGQEYWERNQERLDKEAEKRRWALIDLIQGIEKWERWVEVGCGQGHNLHQGDVGIDIDPRQVKSVIEKGIHGIIAPAYHIPLPDQSYEVVFSVGCLMHLPATDYWAWDSQSETGHYVSEYRSWQAASREMARIARSYVIIGEYWAEQETEIEWHGEKGVLWARPYDVPGFTLQEKVSPLPPFDANITFGIFKKTQN